MCKLILRSIFVISCSWGIIASAWGLKARPDARYWVSFNDGTLIKCRLKNLPDGRFEIQDAGHLNGMIIDQKDIKEIKLAPENLVMGNQELPTGLDLGIYLSFVQARPLSNLKDLIEPGLGIGLGLDMQLPFSFSKFRTRVGLNTYLISHSGKASANISAELLQVPVIAYGSLIWPDLVQNRTVWLNIYTLTGAGASYTRTKRLFVDGSSRTAASVDMALLFGLGAQARFKGAPLALFGEITFRPVLQAINENYLGYELGLAYFLF